MQCSGQRLLCRRRCGDRCWPYRGGNGFCCICRNGRLRTENRCRNVITFHVINTFRNVAVSGDIRRVLLAFHFAFTTTRAVPAATATAAFACLLGWGGINGVGSGSGNVQRGVVGSDFGIGARLLWRAAAVTTRCLLVATLVRAGIAFRRAGRLLRACLLLLRRTLTAFATRGITRATVVVTLAA